jgi:excisionase family DNA binding protein
MSARAAARSEPPRWVSLKEAEAASGIPAPTLRRWISEGRLPAYRLGPRRIQVDLNDVDALRTRIPAVAKLPLVPLADSRDG